MTQRGVRCVRSIENFSAESFGHRFGELAVFPFKPKAALSGLPAKTARPGAPAYIIGAGWHWKGGGMSAGIADVLGSFSVNQLRDLAFAMGSRGVEPPKRNLGKEELLAFFENKKTDANLPLFAHRIEAITPYKHLFLYSLDASKFSFSKTKARIEGVYPKFIGGVRDVDHQGGDLEPEACLADESQNRIYLKLVHQVEMSGWVAVSRTEKRLKEFRKRHPVVITFRPAEGLLTIGFPGFTYLAGVQQENR